MELKIYAVYDSKLGAYMQPFFCHRRGEAIRGFSQAANDKESNIAREPHSFSLMEIGTFNDENALFVCHNAPINLGLATEFINKQREQTWNPSIKSSSVSESSSSAPSSDTRQ